MTTVAAVRKEVAELRARGEDAAARERLKRWRLMKDLDQPEADADDETWRSKLERSLLMRHQEESQSRTGRRLHRLPFVQCRHCDTLRQAALSARKDPAGT